MPSLRKDADVIVISPSEGAEENAEIRALRTPYFDATRNFLNKSIGMTTGEFYGGMQARVVDSAVADLINEAQKWAAKKYAALDVDLSIAAIFLSNNGLPKGSLRLKDAFGIYNFDNTLYIVEMPGKTLREALEQNARYFGTFNGSALPESVDLCKANNPPVADYLWDLYSDIDYTLDVTRVPGKRVTQLRYKHDQRVQFHLGAERLSQVLPVHAGQVLALALSSAGRWFRCCRPQCLGRQSRGISEREGMAPEFYFEVPRQVGIILA